jgi:predicted acyl esterase
MPETFKEVPPDTIIYNPKEPTPSFGGERFNPFDTKMLVGPQDLSDTIEARNDVLVYSTPVLDREIILAGPLKVELLVGSDVPDTDFGIRLTDVYPDGRSIIIRQGIKRMRFRDSYEKELFMKPNEVYTAIIEIDDLAYTFLKGHRLRIDVSSANYSHYDINTNSGEMLYQPGDTITATNLVYHDSRVIIPYFDFGTSVANIEDNDNIILFPIPAADYTQLLIPENMPLPDDVQIFDSIGKKIMVIIPVSRIIQVETENLTSSTYYLLINSGKNQFIKSMMVIR